MLEAMIQAAFGSKITAMRKKVLAECYGGDIVATIFTSQLG